MADPSPLLPPVLLAEPETSDVDEPQASLDSVVERTRNQRGTASTMAFATQVLTYVTFPSLHGPGMDTLTRQSEETKGKRIEETKEN
ncbi:hypothetical protein POTOM_052418 [Populus tomentosa]|uniref:Uncharacterized protein n=1 Tax=Populus tomentosa TaxID=118781 RepID=A0A8X7Y7S7_POPTO|nr:hypothetical protein POTOM_052418 [Populus tomentosa]